MNKILFVLIVLLFGTVAGAAAPRVEFVTAKDRIDVTVAGKLFTSYLYAAEQPKPVLVPIRSPSGIEVSRRYPLVEVEGGSMDHLHHLGLFFCVDRVNGTNFWNYYRNPDGVTPKIKHVRIDQMNGGDGKASLKTIAHWIDKNGKFVLQEDRTMIFVARPEKNEYAIDFAIDLTAQNEKVVFEDIEEGVFAIRVTDYLRETDPKVTFKNGESIPIESIAGTGRYFSSNGDESAKNVWGKRARWVALQGVKQAKVVGIAILNHPASLNYPTYWHVRNYGLFSANPLGQGDFQRQWPRQYRKNKVIPLNLTLEPAQTAHFRFLVIIYEGIRTKADIEQRFAEFVK